MARQSIPTFLSLLLVLVTPELYAQQTEVHESLECFLEPNSRIEISAEVPGVLSEVKVQRGDRVKKGQLLANLKSGPERAAVELAKARVEYGKRKAVRNEDLYRKKMISLHEKDEMDTEIQLSSLQLKQAEELLAQRRITSPIDGIVIERYKDPGEYIETESLLTIVNLDPLDRKSVG